MYKDNSNNLEFENFILPFGGKLVGENRWVKLCQLIPWKTLEDQYRKRFNKDRGRFAKPVRMAFGSLLIKEKMRLSDEETVHQIQENPYLQFFVGFSTFQYKPPFDSSLMVHFRARLGADILKEINEIIVQAHKKTPKDKDPSDSSSDKSGGGNSGRLVVDATCAPQDMKHPNDISLLNDVRVETERFIDQLFSEESVFEAGIKKPRSHREIARRKFLRFIRSRRPTKAFVRKAKRQQLGFIRRNLHSIAALMRITGYQILSEKEKGRLALIKTVFRQQMFLYKSRQYSIPDRVLSLSQPHVRAMARGKARAAYEFGSKIAMSVDENGFCFIDKLSWTPFNEGCLLKEQIETYQQRTGHYPESVHADKIYRTRENIGFCKEKGIRLSGPKLGRPYEKTDENQEILRLQKETERDDEAKRQIVEGRFGTAKRKYNWACVFERKPETSATAIFIGLLLMNLDKILRDLYFIFSNRVHEAQKSFCTWLETKCVMLLSWMKIQAQTRGFGPKYDFASVLA